ncbi:MAG TPA: ubiquitin-like small modifier protein 1 [Thermoanaerobaculia bacterium]|jgi:MoaD family protein
MPVRFFVPGPLREFAGGRAEVVLAATPRTLKEALEALGRDYPGVARRVLNERGEVRPHVNLFVGGECVRFADGLSTALPDGCEIAILPAVSGG